MRYYLLKHVDTLSNNFGGTTYGPLIMLLSKYKYDAGLLAHEKTHVLQWYMLLAIGLVLCTLMMLLMSTAIWPMLVASLSLHQLLYKFIRPYRRWCEVKAYKKQISVGNYTSTDFAVTALVKNYDLGLSVDEARALLIN